MLSNSWNSQDTCATSTLTFDTSKQGSRGCMLQVTRGVEDVWAPPGGASISTAAAAEGVVVASCTHFKVSQHTWALHALQGGPKVSQHPPLAHAVY